MTVGLLRSEQLIESSPDNLIAKTSIGFKILEIKWDVQTDEDLVSTVFLGR